MFSKQNGTHGHRNKDKHIFFTSSQVFHTQGSEQHSASSPISASSFRDAFVKSVRRIERRPSLPSFKMPPQAIPFKFQIPRTVGQGMPPTFNVSSMVESGSSEPAHSEKAEVTYMVTALWEASNGCDRALYAFHCSCMWGILIKRYRVEAPIALHPDGEFNSLDGVAPTPSSWLELPLRTDRPKIPFQCAVG